MNLRAYGITSPIDRALAKAWLHEMRHYEPRHRLAALRWYRDVGRHCRTPAEFEQKAYAAAETQPDLFQDMAAVGCDLAIAGPAIIEAAQKGGRPLLPEFQAVLRGDAPAEDDVSQVEAKMPDEKNKLRQMMRDDPEGYRKKDFDGFSPQDRLLQLMRREERTDTLAPQGKYANRGDVVCIEHHKPEFILPANVKPAPGFRSFAPIGEGTMKETRP